MASSLTGRARSGRAARAVLAAALVLPAHACGSPPVAEPPSSRAAAPLPEERSGLDPGAAAVPVQVRLPRLRISAALESLRLGPEQVLVPPAYGRAGWYAGGPEPGELGRAVIAGHLDSKQGPDVFWNLRHARAGDRILVDLEDGGTVRFVVDHVETFPRSAFPTEQVYGGPRKAPELRLITCAGPYDRAGGGYQGNVVVFAGKG